MSTVTEKRLVSGSGSGIAAARRRRGVGLGVLVAVLAAAGAASLAIGARALSPGEVWQGFKAHPEFAGQTAVVVSWYEDSVAPFTTTDVRGRLVSGIGFKGATEIDKIAGGKFYTVLSPERIDLIDVDRIFVVNDKADQEALKRFELFANLSAVKKGKVSYLLNSEGPAIGAAMSQGTLLSLPYAIDEIVKSVG